MFQFIAQQEGFKNRGAFKRLVNELSGNRIGKIPGNDHEEDHRRYEAEQHACFQAAFQDCVQQPFKARIGGFASQPAHGKNRVRKMQKGRLFVQPDFIIVHTQKKIKWKQAAYRCQIVGTYLALKGATTWVS
ncbi:MAG: hypothetical protein WHT06_04095 [Desulfobacterales bacterium]